ncbi:MAG: DNA repair protein RecN [bacterium]|nr:DNA repair protein RecN [bacterium]
MLRILKVTDFALIDELDLSFEPKLNVLTGETGAGKSILIDALGQVLGERTDLTNIRSDAESSVVEALFDISDNQNLQTQLAETGLADENQSELLIRREVAKSGRSRAWINGNIATLNLLQQFGAELVDIHGQHQHQSLLKTNKQLDLIDDYAGLLPLRTEFAKTLTQYRSLGLELKTLTQSQADTLRQQEILQYQIDELKKAELQESEEAELTAERNLLSQSEKLQLLSAKAVDELYGSEFQSFGGLISGIDRVRLAVEELTRIDATQKPIIAEIENIKATLDELYRTLRAYRDTIIIDPKRLELIEERLNLIHQLKRKYSCDSISALLSRKKEWEESLYNLTHQEERIAELEKELNAARKTVSESATRLSAKRIQAGKKLGQLIATQLTDLGMTKTRFVVDVNQKEDPDGILEYNGKKIAVTGTGIDQLEFLFSANPGEELKPLSKIISGGELSRVMLAIKNILANLDDVPTLVFDEIDVGIGGGIAQVIGRKLRQLTDSRQVIVITHLPQIAAAAHNHFLVTKTQNKSRTFTKISPLDGADKVQEIARMLSGESVTPTAIQHAESLLAEFSGTKKTSRQKAGGRRQHI